MEESIEVAATGAVELFQYGAIGVIVVVLIAFIVVLAGVLVWVIKENKKELQESRSDTLVILKEGNKLMTGFNKTEVEQSGLMKQIVDSQNRCYENCLHRRKV